MNVRGRNFAGCLRVSVYPRRSAQAIGKNIPLLEIAMEPLHSRNQQLFQFIGTKESFYIRKRFSVHMISLGHQHGLRFIVLVLQYGGCGVM